MKRFSVSTQKRYQLVDITGKVKDIVKQEDVSEGMVSVSVPHSTAGVLVSENESGLKDDFLKMFKELVSGFDFKHNRIDNNADSHILSALVGQEKSFPVKSGKIVKGTWQQIFVAEFDGSRSRKVVVKITKDND